MPVTPPVAPDAAPDNIQKIYDRIRETFGNGDVPVGFQMKGHVEPFLQDAYMNYRKFVVDGTGKLDDDQRKAIALATVSAMACTHCVRQHAKEAQDKLGWSQEKVAEVLAVTATCAMYNVYYKFKDLAGDPQFEGMSVGLRAHTFQKTSLDDSLVELINVVVSNINGCPMCTSGHVKKAMQLGMSADQIDEAVRISGVLAAFATYHRTQ